MAEMVASTLTEAQAEAGLVVISSVVNAAHLSSSRQVPYAELYRERTGVIETPIEHIQRAAEDQAKRMDRDSQ
jgi:hypothetical protein